MSSTTTSRCSRSSPPTCSRRSIPRIDLLAVLGRAERGCYADRLPSIPMAEFSIDRFVDRYAERTSGMSASEVRALFAVASRPDVVSLAGGMPFVQAIGPAAVTEVVAEAFAEHGSMVLQYGGGQGHLGLRERLPTTMADEGVEPDPDDMVIT